MLTSFAVAARRRRYELAAVLVLGGSRRSLTAAARREQLSLVGLGTLLGTAAGVAGIVLVLPRLPTVTGGGGPLAATALQPLPVAATVAATIVVVAALTQLGARRVVASATPERLREVQA